MAKRPAYQTDESVKVKLLWALRSGQSLADAAAMAGHPLRTVQGWIESNAELRAEVERAEAHGAVARTNAPVARDEKTGADRWKGLRADAAKFAPGMLGFLYAVEARLAARPGAHTFSPYVRWMLTNWYQSGKPVLLWCGGRGIGKSDTQTAVTVTEGIFADRNIPPGETWIWPYLSKDMNETNLKFGPLKSALNAVGLGDSDLTIHRRKDGRSEIGFEDAKGQPIEVRVYPNTKDALRGPTLCGGTNDEEAFWRADRDLGTSSADDVLDAMAGAFRGDATEKKQMRISSANTTNATLMRDIETGDTELHFVARLGPFVREAVDGFELVASKLLAEFRFDDARVVRQWAASLSEDSPWIPSWVGNPTHDVWGGFLRLRKRVAKWLRENGSKPSDGSEEGDYFEPETIDRSTLITRIVTREVDGRFAAIDTGAKKNPSALAIVERVVHEVRVGTSTRERRYQWRPLVLKQWMRKPGGLPLDLRNAVLPAMARLILENKCIPAWWTDGWAGDQIEHVARSFGLQTIYVSTSTSTRDIYEPLDAALAHDPCPVVLAGCEGIEQAVAQLRQVRRASDGKAVVPHQGTEHGELGQVLARALAHAGVGTLPPGDSPEWRSFGSDRGEGSAYESRRE